MGVKWGVQGTGTWFPLIWYFKLYIYFVLFMHLLDIILFLGFCVNCDKQQNNTHFYKFASCHYYVMDFLTTFVEISFCTQNFVLHSFYTTAVVYAWIYIATIVYFSKLHDCRHICMNLDDYSSVFQLVTRLLLCMYELTRLQLCKCIKYSSCYEALTIY